MLELIVAALGGGVVATGLGAWVGWLRTFETARLQCDAEIDLLAATSQLVELEQTDGGVDWPAAWSRYRDVLAIGLEGRDGGLYDELETYLSTTAVLSRGGLAFDDARRIELLRLQLRLRRLAPRWLSGVMTYGWGYSKARRRQKRTLALAEHKVALIDGGSSLADAVKATASWQLQDPRSAGTPHRLRSRPRRTLRRP